jgi:hypothetical protein
LLQFKGGRGEERGGRRLRGSGVRRRQRVGGAALLLGSGLKAVIVVIR